MARSLNLDNVVRWIHWAPPGDMDGVYQASKAKMESLGLKPGKRDNILPKNIPGDPSINVRGVIQFIDGCEAVTDGDSDAEKAAKTDCHKKLCQLYATLSARVA